MINKRGSELAIGTIVMIVIAVVVLVVLVVGFTSGWGNLWSNISAFFGGGSNVDTVVKACTVACTTQSQNAFCTEPRDVTYKSATGDKKGATGSKVTIKAKTCKALATEQPTLGFKDCPGLCA